MLLQMLIFLSIDFLAHICLEMIHLMMMLSLMVKLLMKLQLSG